MNIVFHTTTAIGVAVLLTDTKRFEQSISFKKAFWTGLLVFTVAIILHGALDYTPHCYPINSKPDAVIGLTMMIFITVVTNKKYRLIVGLAFLGSVFPDLVDLAPSIINKKFGLNLPIFEKLFPWHLRDYSGSIYNNDCNNSMLNHILLLLTIGIVCWCRRTDFKSMFV